MELDENISPKMDTVCVKQDTQPRCLEDVLRDENASISQGRDSPHSPPSYAEHIRLNQTVSFVK